ncbi:MAG: hypothetical protein ABI426_09780 [Flavobacterium sp.]
MKTIIYTLGIFALLVSPTTCTSGKLNFQNNTNSTADNGSSSKEGDDECTIIIDPTKPIPKP